MKKENMKTFCQNPACRATLFPKKKNPRIFVAKNEIFAKKRKEQNLDYYVAPEPSIKEDETHREAHFSYFCNGNCYQKKIHYFQQKK